MRDSRHELGLQPRDLQLARQSTPEKIRAAAEQQQNRRQPNRQEPALSGDVVFCMSEVEGDCPGEATLRRAHAKVCGERRDHPEQTLATRAKNRYRSCPAGRVLGMTHPIRKCVRRDRQRPPRRAIGVDVGDADGNRYMPPTGRFVGGKRRWIASDGAGDFGQRPEIGVDRKVPTTPASCISRGGLPRRTVDGVTPAAPREITAEQGGAPALRRVTSHHSENVANGPPRLKIRRGAIDDDLGQRQHPVVCRQSVRPPGGGPMYPCQAQERAGTCLGPRGARQPFIGAQCRHRPATYSSASASRNCSAVASGARSPGVQSNDSAGSATRPASVIVSRDTPRGSVPSVSPRSASASDIAIE